MKIQKAQLTAVASAARRPIARFTTCRTPAQETTRWIHENNCLRISFTAKSFDRKTNLIISSTKIQHSATSFGSTFWARKTCAQNALPQHGKKSKIKNKNLTDSCASASIRSATFSSAAPIARDSRTSIASAAAWRALRTWQNENMKIKFKLNERRQLCQTCKTIWLHI